MSESKIGPYCLLSIQIPWKSDDALTRRQTNLKRLKLKREKLKFKWSLLTTNLTTESLSLSLQAITLLNEVTYTTVWEMQEKCTYVCGIVFNWQVSLRSPRLLTFTIWVLTNYIFGGRLLCTVRGEYECGAKVGLV